MSAAYGFVVAAFALLPLFAYFAARRFLDLRNIEHAGDSLRSLDIEAFRNLTDPAEEQFLRSELPPLEFKKIKRERAQAALAYVTVLSRASLELTRFGAAAQRSADPTLAALGRDIANSAINLRLQTLKASANLRVATAFPGLSARPLGALLDQYDRSIQLMQAHSSLQRARGRI
jgi:hypothetical protein